MTKYNKESLRNLLREMVFGALDEETQELHLRLAIERQKAVDALIEENRSVIRDIVEDGKKRIQSNSPKISGSDACPINYIDDLIEHLYKMMGVSVYSTSSDTPASEVNTSSMNPSALTQLEILPAPRPGRNISN